MSQPLISLFIDADRPGGGTCRLRAGDTSDLDTSRLDLTSLDLLALRVYFRTFASAAAGETWQKEATAIVAAILTPETALDDATPAEISALTPLAEASEGDPTVYYYAGILDLTYAAVATALGSLAEINCALDITVRDDTTRNTYRLLVTLHRSAQGALAVGALTTFLVNSSGAQIRQVSSGKFQFYDQTAAAWYEPSLENGVLKWYAT